MSGRRKAGSWQEGVARSFSRFFNRNASPDPEDGNSPEKPSSNDETNRDPRGEGETAPERADSHENETICLKSENNNTSHPSLDQTEGSLNEDENSSSCEEQRNCAAKETQTGDLTSVTPDIKAPDHDRQPKENFLQFLGNLFKIAPKSASADVKQTPEKEENADAEKDLQDQSGLHEAGVLKQDQPDLLGSFTVLESNKEAAANQEDTTKTDLTPAPPQDAKAEDSKETTEAPKRADYKDEAPAVTYATYRGSRRIRKLLKRRASVDSAIPEREDSVESQDTFTVTGTGDIVNVGSTETENEGHLPNGILVNGDENHPHISHTLLTMLTPNALVKDIVHPISVENSNSFPNLAGKSNSSSNEEHELDLLPLNHSLVSRNSEVCNKLTSPVILKVNSSNGTLEEVSESAEVPFQPNTSIYSFRNEVNSEHHYPVKVEEETSPKELEVSSNIGKKEVNEECILFEGSDCIPTAGEPELKNVVESSKLADGLHPGSEMARKRTASFEHIDISSSDFSNSVMSVQESNVHNNASKTNISLLDNFLPTFEEINSNGNQSLEFSTEDNTASRIFHDSEDFNESGNLTFSCKPGNTVMSNVVLPDTKFGNLQNETILTEPEFGSMTKSYSLTQDPIIDLQAKMAITPTASIEPLYNVDGDTTCPPAFAYDSKISTNNVTDLPFDDGAVSKKSKLQFEVGDISKMSALGMDDCRPASIASSDIASHEVSMDTRNTRACPFNGQSSTDDSCPKLVPYDEIKLGCNPETLDPADDKMSSISPSALASDKIHFPVIASNNGSFAKMSSPSLDSSNDAVAKANHVSAAGNDRSANVPPSILTTSDSDVAKISPSTVIYNNSSICAPSLSCCNDNASMVPSSTGSCINNNMTELASSTIVLENSKLTNKNMKEPDIIDKYSEEPVPAALESGDVFVAKISMKSVNVNEVKISPYVFQSEVVKLSRLSSTAFEPEYVCLPNLSPPPLLEPVNTSALMVSTTGIEIAGIPKVNINSSTIDTGNVQVITIFQESTESGNDSAIVPFPPSDSYKDMDSKNGLAKSKKHIKSHISTSKDNIIDNISVSTVKPDIVPISATFPSALHYEDDNEKKTKHTMDEIRNVTVNDNFPSLVNSDAVAIAEDVFPVLETEVFGKDKQTLKMEDVTIAPEALPLETEEDTLIKQCPIALESMDIIVRNATLPNLKSKASVLEEISPLSVTSELINYADHENNVNQIKKDDAMLGKSCLAALEKSVCETNADVAISEIKLSCQSPEEYVVKESNIKHMVPHVDMPVVVQDLRDSVLHKAGEIASDVMHLSMEEIKSTHKIDNPEVGEHQFKRANLAMIHEKQQPKRAYSEITTGQSVSAPVECFDDNYTQKILNVMENDSNLNSGVSTTCNDFSMNSNILCTHDLLALKAEQIVNEVMSLAKQKLSSDHLKNGLRNNQHEATVNTTNHGVPDSVTVKGGNTVAVIEPLWSIISSAPKLHRSSFEDSEFIESSFPTCENVSMDNTSTIGKCVDFAHSDELTSEENSLFSFDDSTSGESDSAEIKGDTMNGNVTKVKMFDEKLIQNNISTVSDQSKAVFEAFNENERMYLEEIHNYEDGRLSTTQFAGNNKNSLSSEEKEGVDHNRETEGKHNHLTNVLHHETYRWKRSLSEGGLEDEDHYILEEGNEIYTPPSPDMPIHNFQRLPICEENEDEPSYYYDGTNLINEASDSTDPDSFVTVQAKPFRMFPFALSPIYEGDSSQEEALSSDNSPDYSEKRSATDSSSVLSLLQSVSERLKNSLDEEEEESREEKETTAQNDDWTDLKKVPIVDGLDNASPYNVLCGSSEGPASINLQTQQLLKETFPSLLSGDSSNRLPKTDIVIKSASAPRSVYYQYLQSAKDYSCEKGPRMESMLHEILQPKDSHLKVSDSTKAEPPLANSIDKEGLKYNPRPGKMIIYNVLCNDNNLEIYNDVLDATFWTFPNEAWIRVVRGCWVLYEKPLFQGQPHVLEEGETMLNNLWDLQNNPSNVTIGSIQRMIKDGSIPEIEICSQSGTSADPLRLHSEVSSLPEHEAGIPPSITVKSGVWLAYSDAHFKGKMTILEPGSTPSHSFHEDVKSLRPLKMGGLKVQMPIDPKIIIYEKNNFNGWSKTLTEHVYSVTSWFNNEKEFRGIGSIRVCGGVWVAYDQEKYKGHQYLLEEGEYADWHAWGGVSSTVLSFRYLQAEFLESSVTLYESDADDGRLIDILNREIPDLEQAGFCRETRSIHVQRGMWVAYQQHHFCGEQYILEKGKYKCFSDWGGNGNTILSIRPVMLEPLGRDKPQHLLKAYSGDNFHGECVEYMSEVSEFKADMPCSFKVLQGCWLLSYQGDIADDQCVLEEGHFPDLTSCGCPAARIKSLKPIDYVFAEPTISLFALDSCEGRELYFEEAVNSVLSKDLHFYTQSVWVRSGLWIAYEGANFLGKQILLESGEILNWSEFSGWKAIGSLRPVKQPEVYVKIKNRAQDNYLTVTGKLTDARATTVCVAPDNGKNTQIWYYCRGLFKSKVNNACLDVIGGREAPGSKVALWTEHGKSRQKWRLNKDGTITSYLSDELVLDVKGGNYYDKNSIIVNYPLEHELKQKWDMEIL